MPPIDGAIYSPDGKRILWWSNIEEVLWLWDAEKGKAISQPMQHEGHVTGFSYSPDGTRILSWRDHTLRLWDAATGAAIGEPMRREDEIIYAVFLPDGKRILSASDDKTLQLWDVATGAAIGEPLGHKGVEGAVHSPDGKRICRGLLTTHCGFGTPHGAGRTAGILFADRAAPR